MHKKSMKRMCGMLLVVAMVASMCARQEDVAKADTKTSRREQLALTTLSDVPEVATPMPSMNPSEIPEDLPRLMLLEGCDDIYEDDQGILYNVIPDEYAYVYGYKGDSETTITIPNEVVVNNYILPVKYTVGGAFDECKMKRIEIPKNVTELGAGTFRGCMNLTEIVIDEENPYLTFQDGGIYDKDMSELMGVLPSVSELEIPLTVGKIREGAFSGCAELVSLFIPAGVGEIASGLFRGCTKLKDITISPDNSKYCTDEAGNIYTKDMSTLIQVAPATEFMCVPEGVTTMASSCFVGCENMTELVISKDVDSINCMRGLYYMDCKNLQKVTVVPENRFYCADEQGCIYNKDMTVLYRAPLKGNIELPEGLEVIEEGAFDYSQVEKIQLPDSLLKLGGAFGGSRIQTIEIPGNVGMIEAGCFNYCRELSSITVPPSVGLIEMNDLYVGCAENLTIYGYSGSPAEEAAKGNLVSGAVIFSSQGQWKTYVKDGLEYVMGEDTCMLLSCQDVGNGDVVIPSEIEKEGKVYSVRLIAPEAFRGREDLIRVTLPLSVKWIEKYTFYDCTNLLEVTIPEGVEEIGDRAFAGCQSLTEVVLPQSVIRIEADAFASCHSVKKLVIPAKVNKIGVLGNTTGWEICSGFTTIYGERDSAAQTYAEKHFLAFKVIGEEEAETPVPTSVPIDMSPTTSASPMLTVVPEKDLATKEPEATSAPVKKGTVLEDTKIGCKVTVTSTKKGKKTVEYRKPQGEKAKLEKKVTVPDTVTVDGVKYKVTSVAKNAFANNKNITKVTVGKHVTSIGKNAFKNCKKLKRVDIRSTSIRKVGKGALKGTSPKLTLRVQGKKVKVYKKLFKGKGNKSVKIKKR